MRLFFMILLGCHWSHKTTTWHGDRRKSEPISWSVLIRNALRGKKKKRGAVACDSKPKNIFVIRNSDHTKPDLWKWLTIEFKQTLFAVFKMKNLIRVIRKYTSDKSIIKGNIGCSTHIYEDISFCPLCALSDSQWNKTLHHEITLSCTYDLILIFF